MREDLYQLLKQGKFGEFNRYREEHPDERIDLSRADVGVADLYSASLRGMNLRGVNLSEANLRGVNLRAVNLREADLGMADLGMARAIDADLSMANLTGANLTGANFSGANFSGAILMNAKFGRAILSGADFSEAMIGLTIFAHTDLRTVKGLETVKHRYPSEIGIHTIQESEGSIPESFLRGCGVPDDFITYMQSLTTQPIQYYSCFISYSHKDEDFAQRLYNDLQGEGVRCWYAPEDMKGGGKLHEQIDLAIRLHDKLLLVLSEQSMNSEWVRTEITNARQQEASHGNRVLFPIRLVDWEAIRTWQCFDADTGKDSAREIREYFIPDFSNWKSHDDYQQAFDRLLRDLKGETA